MPTEYLKRHKYPPAFWVCRRSLLICYKFPPWDFEADQNFDNKYKQQLDSILICDCSVTEDNKMSEKQEITNKLLCF